MAIMSQQMSPEMLTAMLSDPRAQPAQRMAAMNMLNQMQGGGGSPMAAPMAAPQGDGTGAGDMDPSFIRAVQREMQGEQAPQGLPPAQGQQMAQAPQDQGVQGDIAAGVEAASGFAQGGAVRGYAEGGVLRVGRERFINAPGMNFDFPQGQMGQNPMFPNGTSLDVETEEADPAGGGKYGLLLEDAIKKQLESKQDETTPEDDRNSALLKFGLGMMTSAAKPGATFLGSAGEGGLNAVSEFEKARANRAEGRMKNLSLLGTMAGREEDRAEKIATRIQKGEETHAKLMADIKSDDARLAETKRHNDFMREIGLARTDNMAQRAAEKLEEQGRTKAADVNAYTTRVKEWNKNGGIFQTVPTDALYGFKNPQGEEPINEQEEAKKPVMERRTTGPTERNRLRTTLPDAEYEYRSTDNAVNDLLKKVSALPLHKGFSATVGATLQPGFKGISGTDAASFMAALKGVNSSTLISMIKDLKASGNGASGFGSLTEKEGEYLIQALGSLEISQDEDQFKTTVDDIVDTLNRKRGALENKWKNIYGGTFIIKSDDEKTKGDGGTPNPDQTLPKNPNDKRPPLGSPGAGGGSAPV